MARKTKSKSATSTASSWWEERHKILSSITEPKPARAKAKRAKAKKVSKTKKALKKVTKAKKAKKR